MNLSFKIATENDAPAISKLGHKIWHEHYPGIISIDQINFMLNDRYSVEAITKGMQRGEKYFIALDGVVPVAIADVEERQNDNFLHKFYVDVSKHRGGIGAGFFAFILKNINKTRPMRLQVNRLNYKAINFYFKNGFVIETTGDFDIGGGYFMN